MFNPRRADGDLSMKERLCYVARVLSSVPERGREKECFPDRPGHKCSCKHSHGRRHDSPHRLSPEEVLKTAKRLTPAPPGGGWQLRHTTSGSDCSSEFIPEDGQI